MAKEKPDLIEWLGFRRLPDFRKAHWLGVLISGASISVLAVVSISVFIAFMQAVWSDDPDGIALRNTGLVLAAMIGVPFLVWRSVVAQKQVDVAEQGQITDRINKAVEGLGAEKTTSRVWRNVTYEQNGVPMTAYEGRDKGADLPEGAPITEYGKWEIANRTRPNLEVRIGAIYALERIAQDSDRDHIQIMEILCAYVRENAPRKTAKEITFDDPNKFRFDSSLPELPPTRSDIQTALTVLGRRSKKQIGIERKKDFHLNLSNCNLQRADLKHGHWRGTDFGNSALDKADLQNTHFQSASFRDASLIKFKFKGGHFEQADFSRAQLHFLQNPRELVKAENFTAAKFYHTTFTGISINKVLFGANCRGTIFSLCKFSGQWMFSSIDENTRFTTCALQNCDFTDGNSPLLVYSDFFGDMSVTLPEGSERPPHWSDTVLDENEFAEHWRAWQKSQQVDSVAPGS